MIFNPANQPKLSNAIARLKSGVAYPSDFGAFVDALKEFSALSVDHALYGIGELGQVAKGAAQAYREILRMIDNASPVDEGDDAAVPKPIFRSPGDPRDQTGGNNNGGKSTPAPMADLGKE